MNVCFTGHRKIAVISEIEKRLIDTLETLIAEGAADFYAGGAIGFDMMAESAVISLKNKYPCIKLHLILPCSNEEQTNKWSNPEREMFYKILNSADSVEYTSEHYTKECMKIRNQRLVDLADCCVCYYSGVYKSGTGQTVRMAQRKGIPVYNVYDMGGKKYPLRLFNIALMGLLYLENPRLDRGFKRA